MPRLRVLSVRFRAFCWTIPSPAMPHGHQTDWFFGPNLEVQPGFLLALSLTLSRANMGGQTCPNKRLEQIIMNAAFY